MQSMSKPGNHALRLEATRLVLQHQLLQPFVRSDRVAGFLYDRSFELYSSLNSFKDV